MRARYPDTEGFIERGGVKVGYEVFGAGEPAILLLTSWAIVHARQWKAQVPYLARHFQVITVEGSAQLLVAEGGGWWLEGVYD